jgi:cytochrome c553
MPTRKRRLIAGAVVAALAAGALPLLPLAQDNAPFTDGPTADDLDRLLQAPDDALVVPGRAPVDAATLERGRLVAMGGTEAGGSSMACITCHGANGRGDGSGAFPRLTGQPAWYLYKQLLDYAEGSRPNRVMSGIAERMTEAEMEAVALYYAAVDAPFRPVRGQVNGLTLQWGGQLAAVGSAEEGIPACVNCHGASGTGLPPSVPYLAGQYADYMVLQLQLWKAGIRDNDAMDVMSSIAAKMTDEDMRAVSEYFARVRPEEDPGDDSARITEPQEPVAARDADSLLPLGD